MYFTSKFSIRVNFLELIDKPTVLLAYISTNTFIVHRNINFWGNITHTIWRRKLHFSHIIIFRSVWFRVMTLWIHGHIMFGLHWTDIVKHLSCNQEISNSSDNFLWELNCVSWGNLCSLSVESFYSPRNYMNPVPCMVLLYLYFIYKEFLCI